MKVNPPVEPVPTDLVTLKAAALLLPGRSGKGLHAKTLLRRVHAGQLMAWCMGARGQLYVSAAAVMALMCPVLQAARRSLEQEKRRQWVQQVIQNGRRPAG